MAVAAAAGTQAQKSKRTVVLVREQPEAATAVALIYGGTDCCACALGAAFLRAGALHRARESVGRGGQAQPPGFPPLSGYPFPENSKPLLWCIEGQRSRRSATRSN